MPSHQIRLNSVAASKKSCHENAFNILNLFYSEAALPEIQKQSLQATGGILPIWESSSKKMPANATEARSSYHSKKL
ncbi:hypothetical protein [Pedobacter panaciterrae]